MKKLHKDKSVTQGDLDNLSAGIVGAIQAAVKDLEDKLEPKFTNIDKRFDTLDGKVDALDAKVSDIHRRTRDLEGDTAGLQQVIDHERRIKKLESSAFASV